MTSIVKPQYQASDILYWVDVLLWTDPESSQPSLWWHFVSPRLYPHYSEQDAPLASSLTTWWTCPVINQVSDLWGETISKIIKPKEICYQHRRISGFTWGPQDFPFVWLLHHPAVLKINSQPTPCARCGWYCNQSCGTWTSRSSFLV